MIPSELLLNLMIKGKHRKEEMLLAFKPKLKTNSIIAKVIYSSFSGLKIYLNVQLTVGNRKILCYMALYQNL